MRLNSIPRTLKILIASSDVTARRAIGQTLGASWVLHELIEVTTTSQLLEYLYREGQYADPRVSPRPDLILLDLDMPKQQGWRALRAIEANPGFRCISVALLSNRDAGATLDPDPLIEGYPRLDKSFHFVALVTVLQQIERKRAA